MVTSASSARGRRLQLQAALVLAAALVPAAAGAEAVDATTLALGCTGCHGVDGHSRGAMPSLAGANAQVLAEAMTAFRNGERQGTVMNRLAKGYDDAQIQALAAWFSSRK
jgi:cytochrome c553